MPSTPPDPIAQIIGTVILALIVGVILAVWLKEWVRRRGMSPAELEAEQQAAKEKCQQEIAFRSLRNQLEQQAAKEKRQQEGESQAERMRLQAEREKTIAEAVPHVEGSATLAVASAPPTPGEWIGTTGVLLILAGVVIYLLSLLANTSIPTGTHDVTNLSLQQQQMIGIVTGLALIVAGLHMVALHGVAARICHATKMAADSGKPQS